MNLLSLDFRQTTILRVSQASVIMISSVLNHFSAALTHSLFKVIQKWSKIVSCTGLRDTISAESESGLHKNFRSWNRNWCYLRFFISFLKTFDLGSIVVWFRRRTKEWEFTMVSYFFVSCLLNSFPSLSNYRSQI